MLFSLFYSIKNCIFVTEKMVNYTKMKAKQNKQSFPFVALFSVTKENNSATTEFVGATRNLNALFFTEEFFESYPLIYKDEFGRVVRLTTEPELKGVEVTPYQEISIYNQMGEFIAFLSDLKGKKKGVLEYDPAASCYWKPIDDLSQEELTLFLGAKNCAEKNSIAPSLSICFCLTIRRESAPAAETLPHRPNVLLKYLLTSAVSRTLYLPTPSSMQKRGKGIILMGLISRSPKNLREKKKAK